VLGHRCGTALAAQHAYGEAPVRSVDPGRAGVLSDPPPQPDDRKPGQPPEHHDVNGPWVQARGGQVVVSWTEELGLEESGRAAVVDGDGVVSMTVRTCTPIASRPRASPPTAA
jgi:hypothetical protein